jgi:hypothetical protein
MRQVEPLATNLLTRLVSVWSILTALAGESKMIPTDSKKSAALAEYLRVEAAAFAECKRAKAAAQAELDRVIEVASAELERALAGDIL